MDIGLHEKGVAFSLLILKKEFTGFGMVGSFSVVFGGKSTPHVLEPLTNFGGYLWECPIIE